MYDKLVRKSHSKDMAPQRRPAQSEGVSCLQGKACQAEGTACAKVQRRHRLGVSQRPATK